VTQKGQGRDLIVFDTHYLENSWRQSWWQSTTYRKWPPRHQLVRWPKTPRDSEKSRWWPQSA